MPGISLYRVGRRIPDRGYLYPAVRQPVVASAGVSPTVCGGILPLHDGRATTAAGTAALH